MVIRLSALNFIYVWATQAICKKIYLHPSMYIQYPPVRIPFMAPNKIISYILKDWISGHRFIEAIKMEAVCYLVSRYFDISYDLSFTICRATTGRNDKEIQMRMKAFRIEDHGIQPRNSGA
ncbi:uncharacterized protein LOC141907777 [Tubulanus polymorphus]|uniref:uncharacterized protein LOC141907777 n=1 Tax=Tubulanus polymorphus TaxID=672921 RepID=UPI003DA3923D